SRPPVAVRPDPEQAEATWAGLDSGIHRDVAQHAAVPDAAGAVVAREEMTRAQLTRRRRERDDLRGTARHELTHAGDSERPYAAALLAFVAGGIDVRNVQLVGLADPHREAAVSVVAADRAPAPPLEVPLELPGGQVHDRRRRSGRGRRRRRNRRGRRRPDG